MPRFNNTRRLIGEQRNDRPMPSREEIIRAFAVLGFLAAFILGAPFLASYWFGFSLINSFFVTSVPAILAVIIAPALMRKS